ncbi:GGDEF domain-containing protein [Sphingomonas quercus]|uniref:diguanylate cyclase n=1 Tax=Sphingomonas quercus TaxID=2842451 RepID=A0ABS6BM89_9SPHN|nr:GGDEF domain-containing protein [Sphingomonas quercus]MBU3078354.1 GGDEF domain-containing protein [Sphingomonas quercus]
MHPAVFVFFSLLVTSIVLVAVLAVAWTSFGRPRHALTWAAGYGTAGIEWLLYLTVVMGWVGFYPARPIILTLGTISATLIMVGFRQRAGLAPRALAIWAVAAAIAAVCIAGSLLAPGGPIDRGLFPIYLAATQIAGASTLVRLGWRATLTERSAFVMMLVFAAFYVGVGALAFVQGSNPSPQAVAAYQSLLLLGTPAIYSSFGLFSVFLLAADLAEQMRRLAILDPLTSIMNRRGLTQAVEAAIANTRRNGHPLSLVVADLDRFKHINDNFGHAAGDRALQRFAAYLESTIRKGDIVSRIGGEEFALLLVNTPACTAMDVAERLRGGLATLDSGTDGVRLSASFGVTSLRPDDIGLGDLFDRADAALYRSKLDGRNRVTLAGEPFSAPWPGEAAGHQGAQLPQGQRP